MISAVYELGRYTVTKEDREPAYLYSFHEVHEGGQFRRLVWSVHPLFITDPTGRVMWIDNADFSWCLSIRRIDAHRPGLINPTTLFGDAIMHLMGKRYTNPLSYILNDPYASEYIEPNETVNSMKSLIYSGLTPMSLLPLHFYQLVNTIVDIRHLIEFILDVLHHSYPVLPDGDLISRQYLMNTDGINEVIKQHMSRMAVVGRHPCWSNEVRILLNDNDPYRDVAPLISLIADLKNLTSYSIVTDVDLMKCCEMLVTQMGMLGLDINSIIRLSDGYVSFELNGVDCLYPPGYGYVRMLLM